MGVHRFAIATALATFCLLIAGGLVSTTESRLACPDWPLCEGKLIPKMVNGKLFELPAGDCHHLPSSVRRRGDAAHQKRTCLRIRFPAVLGKSLARGCASGRATAHVSPRRRLLDGSGGDCARCGDPAPRDS